MTRLRLIPRWPSGTVPFGDEVFTDRENHQVLVRRRVLLTGENLQDAQPGFDSQTQEPTVNLTLDNKGARIFKEVTRDNVGKRMAIILFEKGHGQVVTAPVIRQEIGGGHVQISGAMTTIEATDTALLLRAGSLAAPMEIVEERLVGPSLGQANIAAGFKASIYGFIVVSIFMMMYYEVFGIISAITLLFNVILIVAILSMLQATLTLPGIGALALSIGMSVDSNVLINERIREELRAWRTPQVAIKEGYDSSLRDDCGLERDVSHRRYRSADLRLRSDPRFRCGALSRYSDLALHGGVCLPRSCESGLWPSEAPEEDSHRQDLAPRPSQEGCRHRVRG